MLKEISLTTREVPNSWEEGKIGEERGINRVKTGKKGWIDEERKTWFDSVAEERRIE